MGILAWVLVPLVVLGIALHGLVLHMLRTRHHEHWQRLGSPSLVANNSFKNSCAVQKFLFRREYKNLNDHALERTCSLLRTFSQIYLLILGCVVAGIMLTMPWNAAA